MKAADTETLRHALVSASDAVIAAEPLLTRTDTVIGDGDHGITVKRGFSVLKKELAEGRFDSPYALFHACGISLLKSMGGSSGVLFGTLFIGGLAEIDGLPELDGNALRACLSAGIRAVMKRGKARAGDKTMADALLYAEEYMQHLPQGETGVEQVLRAAAEGAREGAEQTKAMLPRLGRARNFREQALGVPDPGALSVSILLDGMASALEARI